MQLNSHSFARFPLFKQVAHMFYLISTYFLNMSKLRWLM